MTLDVKLAWRLLWKQPVMALTTVVALAVGIGLATTGFTLLDAVLFARLPFAGGDRVALVTSYERDGEGRVELSAERFRFYARQATAFAGLGAARKAPANLRLGEEVVPADGCAITPGAFAFLPFAPRAGRGLEPADAAAGAMPVVVLGEGLWRRRFGGRTEVVGRRVEVGGTLRTVVGVMPADFRFPVAADLWLPLGTAAGSDWEGTRLFGMLRPGVSFPAAQEEIGALAGRFAAAWPEMPATRPVVEPYVEALSHGLDLLAGVLVGALVLILLVIAANVANLMLARTLARSGELAIRTALGAPRRRLIGQIFTEVLLAGAIAAVIGVTASHALLAWVTARLTDMPYWTDFGLNGRTVSFAVAATLLAAAVAGVLPALRATHGDSFAELAANRATARFGLASAVMVACQAALSVALLHGALLMAKGVTSYARGGELPPAPLVAARLIPGRSSPAAPLPGAAAPDRADEAAAILRAARAVPGVSAAALATSLPRLSPPAVRFELEAADGVGRPTAVTAPVIGVSGGFFATLGARPLQGRLLEEEDAADGGRPVAVVDRAFVARFLGGANPVGRRLRRVGVEGGAPARGPWREVVGVVPDLGMGGGDPALAAACYLPLTTQDADYLALRTGRGAGEIEPLLRTALAGVDPRLEVRDVVAFARLGAADRAAFAGIGSGLGAMGGVALALSAMGMYAMISFAVTRRRREIGVRVALGATPLRLLRAVAGRAALPLFVGVLLGVPLGRLVAEARNLFAFRLPASAGPWALPLAAGAMLLAGLLACWLPGRRALAIPPAEALRAE